MRIGEARELGQIIAGSLRDHAPGDAIRLLAPQLMRRIPFRALDEIGLAIGDVEDRILIPFLDQIAAGRAEGGWVVIASALKRRLGESPSACMEYARDYIMLGDAWYAADIFGERVTGPSLVMDFESALSVLSQWRSDPNCWVRRAVGVAVHFWAKQSRGEAEGRPQALLLLDFLSPMFSECDLRAAKGVGWGLKTMGRYYPRETADWLCEQVAKPHRKPMLSKAMTYLPPSHRERIILRCGLGA